MTNKESQEEELEVLQSIYDGDDCFKEINPTTFQYKVGEDGSYHSFLVEISWGEDYPEQLPEISLGAFYNKHLLDDVKETIITALNEQADMWIGSAMTYTLFEYAKEQMEELLVNQPTAPPQNAAEIVGDKEEKVEPQAAKQKEKKEQLTKAQKRKMYNRLDNKGEHPRGWDWVDVIKHLSQTGKQASKENS